jgi:hypothetical protein
MVTLRSLQSAFHLIFTGSHPRFTTARRVHIAITLRPRGKSNRSDSEAMTASSAIGVIVELSPHRKVSGSIPSLSLRIL